VLAFGGQDESAPGIRDPVGNKLQAVCYGKG
jgi:hypothetical protein